jgi:hypothetical protein
VDEPAGVQTVAVLEQLADMLHLAVDGGEAVAWDELTPERQAGWLRAATLVNQTVAKQLGQIRAQGVDIELIAASLMDPLIGAIVRNLLLKKGIRMTLLAVDNHPEAATRPKLVQ